MKYYIHPCSFAKVYTSFKTSLTHMQLLRLSYSVTGRSRSISKSSSTLQQNSLLMESQVADSQV